MNSKNKNNFFKLPILDGLELLDAQYHKSSFPFHTHDTFNITLVHEQIFSTKTNTQFWQAQAGSIVITNPHEVHATFCDNKIGNSFFTFYVSPDVLIQLNNNKQVFFETKTINDSFLYQKMVNVSRHFKNFDLEAESMFLNALYLLVSKYATSKIENNRSNTNFQKFLETENLEKFSLEKAASNFGLNKYKFLRLFKAETGLTPNNYILLKRIQKCKQMLQTENDLLSIAIELGFYDAAHLCNCFKKITGITPLAYKKA